MVSIHTFEPLNSSFNFSVFPTVNSDNFSFSFMLKKAEFNQLVIKNLSKKVMLQIFILKLKL